MNRCELDLSEKAAEEKRRVRSSSAHFCRSTRSAALAFLLAGLLPIAACDQTAEPTGGDPVGLPLSLPDGFAAEIFVDGLELPTSIAFPPDGSERLFINELQSGRVVVLVDGERLDHPFVQVETNVDGGFPVAGENGLLGIAFDPDYQSNRFVYLTYAYRIGDQNYGRVERYRDDGNVGVERTVLLDSIPCAPGHQIESLAFGPDDKLYVSVGDAYLDEQAQDSTSVLGKVLRMNRDGSIPDDNPYPGSYTFARGFRNCFDLAFRDNGDLITTCNGPEWNDEMNVVVKGGNYGWPHFTGFGHQSEFVDPAHLWEDVVSPTGMLIYQGNQFPEPYRGKLFQVLFGSTNARGPSDRAKRVQVVDVQGSGTETAAAFEDFLVYKFEGDGNPLDIAEGPDGSLYLSDIFQGRVYRVRYGR